ncbi:hypothetical protein [Halopseudomonas bauzanensis]|uniref:hypothetical protein n=1 Tax=Halopseudomonas bauzanensis TaxID=653930 RepID=UPI002552A041|nr:hypothetical protein [Halopseudomonas bauzanensis]
MAKSVAERKREQRARDKLKQEQREALLLSRRITLDLYHATDERLLRTMQRANIEEEQDLITRLIHAADRLGTDDLIELVRHP